MQKLSLFLAIIISLFSTTSFANTYPNTLMCYQEKGNSVDRITVSFTTDSEATFVWERKPKVATKWSKLYWSKSTMELIDENTIKGDFVGAGTSWTAFITYYPETNSLVFHRRDSDPKYDDWFVDCE